MNSDLKQLVEDIISGIGNGRELASIMLQAKVFAFKTNNKELLDWIEHEISGYGETVPPDYRIVDCRVKLKIFKPYEGVRSQYIPTEIIKDKTIRERIVKFDFHQPILEIEELAKSNEELVSPLHLSLIKHFRSFVNGDIQEICQTISYTDAMQIVTAVKNMLLDYFLKIDEGENLDFNAMIQKQIPQTMINSTIISGNDNFNADGLTVISGVDNLICNNPNVKEFKSLLSDMKGIFAEKGHHEALELIDCASKELNKQAPSKTLLTTILNRIGQFGSAVGVSVVGNMVSKAVGIIGSL